MRITYVTPHYPPQLGGVETHVRELAIRAARAGHDTRVLTQRLDRTLSAHELVDGVQVTRHRSLVSAPAFAFAPRLWTEVAWRGGELGLVHAHSYHSLAALGTALRKRFPLVFTPHYHGTGHSPLRAALHPPYRRIGRLLFERADAIVCVSQAEATLVAEHFPGCGPRIAVIPNGADVEAIDAAEPFPHERTVLLSAGRLEDYKHVDRTLAAMADLDDLYELVVIGDGPARESLRRLAAQLRVTDRVSFRGRVPDGELRRWLRTAVVLVTMSSNEAFSIISLEALHAGARVIASDIPAHREVASLTAGTMQLVRADIAPAELAARIRAISELAPVVPHVPSWEDVAAETFELYERVRNGPRMDG
jgi:glycosyltransferase involved in cell wall biosynthesis